MSTPGGKLVCCRDNIDALADENCGAFHSGREWFGCESGLPVDPNHTTRPNNRSGDCLSGLRKFLR